ncbi:hypothetical protein PH5382_01258 [Phaeobacter sp. CECT 5382]|uniref:hypothetical protein n=1 Tax=Phaeobacter sp. CECT 5382 TaxID=1712645 RepID=UPI0006DA9790|nr:hypothetical protein [Phaeobacter sp. CECT 5382]CUH87332.1 hypothetical protein PH5382_01258 [Phaeobacter sp. CECT 5382]
MTAKTTTDPTFIHIIDHRTPALWKARLYFTLIPLILIGTGAVLESSAMQWTGFIFTCFLALGVLVKRKSDQITIDQARTRLDELERAASR